MFLKFLEVYFDVKIFRHLNGKEKFFVMWFMRCFNSTIIFYSNMTLIIKKWYEFVFVTYIWMKGGLRFSLELLAGLNAIFAHVKKIFFISSFLKIEIS